MIKKKRNEHIKIFSFILCFVMLLVFSVLATSAKEEEYTPVEWIVDEDLEYVYGGDKRYDRYYVRGAFYGDADSVFYFTNKALYNGSYCQVYGESAHPHIVSVRTEPGISCIFVDDEGKAILDAFLNRTDCIYYLENFNTGSYTNIDADIVTSLEASYNNKKAKLKWINVNELGEADIFEITVHDRTETKAYQHGAIYLMPNGIYYYVCFEDLDNSYFDADGYFSYRSGSVQVYELDRNTEKNINAAISNMITKKYNIIYERDVINGIYDIYGNPIEHTYDPDDSENILGLIIFILVMSFVAGIIPVALLILGIVLANSKKTGKAKCWYALSASAALWILSAALFLLLIIL